MNRVYISAEWLKPMEEAFVKGRKTRALPFFDVGAGVFMEMLWVEAGLDNVGFRVALAPQFK